MTDDLRAVATELLRLDDIVIGPDSDPAIAANLRAARYGIRERLRALLARPVEQNGAQFVWLIERARVGSYWDGRATRREHGPRATYVLDPNDAVQFARKEDAERVIGWLLPDEPVVAREHGWLARPVDETQQDGRASHKCGWCGCRGAHFPIADVDPSRFLRCGNCGAMCAVCKDHARIDAHRCEWPIVPSAETPTTPVQLTATQGPSRDTDFEIIANTTALIITTAQNVPLDDEEAQIQIGFLVKRAIERAMDGLDREPASAPTNERVELPHKAMSCGHCRCNLVDIQTGDLCGACYLKNELADAREIIKATGPEIDILRARAAAAEHRRNSAEHRAQRIVLDQELRERVERLEEALQEILTISADDFPAYARTDSEARNAFMDGRESAAKIAREALRIRAEELGRSHKEKV